MSKFEEMTSVWSPESLADFLEYRRKNLVEAPGNICEGIRGVDRAPYYLPEYHYWKELGPLDNGPWGAVCRCPAADLIYPDPFELSRFRAIGAAESKLAFRAWDSAIGIPSSEERSRPRWLQNVEIIRNSNQHWSDVVRKAMGHIGPLGPHGRILRPHGKYVFDLRNMGEFGWTVLEAAHGLAHRICDAVAIRRYSSEERDIRNCFLTATCRIIHSIAYDVPLYVGSDRREGQSVGYLTRMFVGTNFNSAILCIPWANQEAFKPDAVLAATLGVVMIEPVPAGYLTGHVSCRKEERWSGAPALVVLAGWETVDYLTHMQRAMTGSSHNPVIGYAIRAEDLLPPEMYWAYLALARLAMDNSDHPIFTDTLEPGWVNFSAWIKSDDFRMLISETPAWPCAHCYGVNTEVEGAPKRPKVFLPRNRDRKRWPPDWQRYDADITKCLDITAGAVDAASPTYYLQTGYPRLTRKSRNSAHNAKIRRLTEIARDKAALEMAMRKLYGHASSPRLTARQRRVYEEHKRSTNGNPGTGSGDNADSFRAV